MRTVVSLVAASLALAACSSEREGTFETDEGGGGTITINDGETSTMTFSGEDGEELTVNIGGDIDTEFPAGFTLYRGASVTNTASMSGSNDDGRMIGIESEDPVGDVIAHYRREIEAAGYEVKAEMNAGGMRMMSAVNEQGQTVSVQVMEDDGGSTAHLIFAREG